MTGRPGAARLLAAAFAALTGMGAAAADETFTLTSTTFKAGELMPEKVANSVRGSCAGQNVSPQLSWRGAPADTRSFVLIIFDPQGTNNLGDYRLVAYGVDPAVTSFMEGEVSEPSGKFIGGMNSEGAKAYSGPCPRAGRTHRYSFVLIATDLERDALPPGLPVEALMPKLEGHAMGSAGMTGLFAEP